MIEDIKKEIDDSCYSLDLGSPMQNESEIFYRAEDVDKILDKYKAKENKYFCKYLKICKDGYCLDSDCIWEEYDMIANANMRLGFENKTLKNHKKAWEELLEQFDTYEEGMFRIKDMNNIMRFLEKKYNLGGNGDE